MFSPVFDTYKKLYNSDIEDCIKGETTGNLEDLLLAVGKNHDLSELIINRRNTSDHYFS